MRLYIHAGTAEQARTLSRLMNLGPQDWTYVNKPEVLMGLHGGPLLLFGTWGERPDSQQIIDLAKTRQMTILYINQ